MSPQQRRSGRLGGGPAGAYVYRGQGAEERQRAPGGPRIPSGTGNPTVHSGAQRISRISTLIRHADTRRIGV